MLDVCHLNRNPCKADPCLTLLCLEPRCTVTLSEEKDPAVQVSYCHARAPPTIPRHHSNRLRGPGARAEYKAPGK